VKKIFVSDVAVDQDVKDYFLVMKKAVYSSRNNTKYMSVRLRDRTGQIEGRVWDRVDDLAACFERNDIVYIESKCRSFQDNLQLNITNIRKEDRELAAGEIGEFYPESATGIEQLKADLSQIVQEVENPHLAALLCRFLEKKDLYDRFCLFPASIGVHHVAIGGLLEHSVSMARMAKITAPYIGGDTDLIIAGALLHDLGKIEEMTFRGGFSYSDRGRLLGHITIGAMMLDDLIAGIDGFPIHLADALQHIIVSHHGEMEWGSPRKPMCIEAIVVHYLDNMDAKVMGVKEHIKEAMEDEKWTQFHKVYEQRFYKIPER
jgi:3'-5' exoribonuclease